MTARKLKLQKIELMNWGVNKERLIEKRKLYRKAQTIYPAPVVENQEIEVKSLNVFMVREIADSLFLHATQLQKCYK